MNSRKKWPRSAASNAAGPSAGATSDADTSQPFHYAGPQSPGHIRLLRRLAPVRAAKTGKPMLSFELLDDVRLPTGSPDAPAAEDGETAYSALSYVWGDESNKIPVLVNGRVFGITRNLHAALTHLADEHAARPLWVDALCIDQGNEAEKLDQIEQMGDVYAGAATVLVFLGPGTAGSDAAMDQLREVGAEARRRGSDAMAFGDIAQWPEFLDHPDRDTIKAVSARLEELGDRFGGAGWLAHRRFRGRQIFDLLDRPWFSRVWVVQELLMARRDGAVFACGTKWIDSRCLWGGLFVFLISVAKQFRLLLDIRGTWGALRYLIKLRARLGPRWATQNPSITSFNTLDLRLHRERAGLHTDLGSLLFQLFCSVTPADRVLGCREKVDRIRALVSISTDRAEVIPLVRANADWRDLYRAVARLLVRQGYLDILSLCRDRDAALPSWTTDWSRQQHRSWDLLGPPFDAAAGTWVRVHPGTPEHILALDGHYLDFIEKSTDLGSEWALGPDDPVSQVDVGTRLREVEDYLSHSRYSEEERGAAAWRIPVGDREKRLVGQFVRACEASRTAWERTRAWAATAQLLHMSRDVYEYYLRMLDMPRSRVFASATGYVGICPSETRQGDVVFVPCGSPVPLVIRRRPSAGGAESDEEHWTLVGVAYVYGVMDGELKLGEKADDLRVFRLV